MTPGTDRRSDATAAYCPQCGARVDADANYCSSCGAEQTADVRRRGRPGDDRAGRAGGAAPSRREYDAFRRRVRDQIARGWNVEYDGGDEVVLVDRDIGSIPIHVLLLFTTGGIGNLAYGWYKYSTDADRVVLRAGDSAPRPKSERAVVDDAGATGEADQETSLGRSLAGISLLGVGALVFVTGVLDPAQVVVALTLLLAGLYVFPPTRRRLEDRHPVTAFGPTRSVDERVVTETDRPCSICLSEIDRGVAREYTEEYAVAGVPLYTTEKGENFYCAACATGESASVTAGGSTEASASAPGADPSDENRRTPNREDEALKRDGERT